MKFNKLILGLAAAPLILASCSNKITYEQAKQWVANHYTKSDTKNVYATVDWDYHASVLGSTAESAIKAFFAEIRGYLQIESSHEDYLPYPGKDNTIGTKRIVEQTISYPPLNETYFVSLFNEDSCTFKIIDNALTVTESKTSSQGNSYSRAYAYNQEGYMTGFGQKLNKLKINDQNIIKITVTIDFEYAY